MSFSRLACLVLFCVSILSVGPESLPTATSQAVGGNARFAHSETPTESEWESRSEDMYFRGRTYTLPVTIFYWQHKQNGLVRITSVAYTSQNFYAQDTELYRCWETKYAEGKIYASLRVCDTWVKKSFLFNRNLTDNLEGAENCEASILAHLENICAW